MTDRQQILDVLSRAGLGRFAPEVEALIRPAIVATANADDAVPVGASRFGGEPDLPAGAAWPLAWGLPMEFVAQVKLADLAVHDVERVLPETGSLLFFYNSHWTTSFDEHDAPHECGKVLYVGDDEVLIRSPAPRVEHNDEYGPRVVPRTYAPARLSFAPTLTIPDMGAFVRGDLAAVWDDFLFRHQRELPAAGHQLLGHLAQRDDLGVMSTDDVLLLQLNSDPIPGFDWGKRYFLYFFASASDVENRDFSRVRVEHGICG